MKLNKQYPSVEEREIGHREVSVSPLQLKEKARSEKHSAKFPTLSGIFFPFNKDFASSAIQGLVHFWTAETPV